MRWNGFIVRYQSSGRYNFSLVREDGKEIKWRRNARFSSPEDTKAAALCCVEFDDTIEWKEGKRK